MRRSISILGLAVMVACSVIMASTAFAQAAEATVDVAAMDNGITFMKLLKQGGPLMYPLGLLSVATIGLAVYGFMIVRAGKMLTPELVPPLQDALDHLDLEQAVQICRGTPSILTNIVQAGLQRISDGILDVPSMEKAMEEASVEEVSAGLKTISYLSIIAQIAPMLGLLGTVSGMIKAFQKIGQGGMGKPEVLAGDIGEAMVTTASGLLIGIPAMFLYFYLKNRYSSNISRLGRVIGNLSHRLVAASRRAEITEVAPLGEPAEPVADATEG